MHDKENLFTLDELKTIIDYNPDTGVFTWKVRVNSKVPSGKKAGSCQRDGYCRIRIKSKDYYAHRLAWFYHYGTWPSDFIDHIDGNPSNNRIINLQNVTQRENLHNRKRHRNGRLVGTSYFKRDDKWQAHIYKNNTLNYLGTFNTEQEAHEAYTNAYNKLRSTSK